MKADEVDRTDAPTVPDAGRRWRSMGCMAVLWIAVAVVVLVVAALAALSAGFSGEGSPADTVVPFATVLVLLAAFPTVRLARVVRANRRPPPATAEGAAHRRHNSRRAALAVALVLTLGTVGVVAAVRRGRPPELDGTVATLAKAIGCQDVARIPPNVGALEEATCTLGSTPVVIATFAASTAYLSDNRAKRLVCSAIHSGSRLSFVDGGTWLVGTRSDSPTAAVPRVHLPAKNGKILSTTSC